MIKTQNLFMTCVSLLSIYRLRFTTSVIGWCVITRVGIIGSWWRQIRRPAERITFDYVADDLNSNYTSGKVPLPSELTKISRLMPFREIVPICSENHTKPWKKLCFALHRALPTSTSVTPGCFHPLLSESSCYSTLQNIFIGRNVIK